MIRITSGTAKNKKLKVPKIEGLRPVQEVVKLAIFAILFDKIKGAVCLDLYAGSGNLGIEALSRGAKWCDFVDENKRSIETIQQNLKNCSLLDQAAVFTDDAVKFAVNTHQKYDIIFVDPFYRDKKHKFLMKNLEEILTGDGIVLFLHNSELDMESTISNTNLKLDSQRSYGKTRLSVIVKNHRDRSPSVRGGST